MAKREQSALEASRTECTKRALEIVALIGPTQRGRVLEYNALIGIAAQIMAIHHDLSISQRDLMALSKRIFDVIDREVELVFSAKPARKKRVTRGAK
jgi:hypothetical protein